MAIFCFLILFFWNVFSASIPDQLYGYIDVREGAHMFYWFYGANTTTPRDQLPIILWLQGGPGAGSSGYGNFGEIGPLDEYLKPRNTTWLSYVNLLFIDNPVGSGYSYVDNSTLYTKNVQEIADDLLTIHKTLIAKYTFMSTLPYWIFSESYGGKMTAYFGNVLYDSIINGDININFQGVMLGDSWINGIDYVLSWPAYLYSLSLLDDNQFNSLVDIGISCLEAETENQWENATDIWGYMEDMVLNYTDNVDFYNVLVFDNPVQISQTRSKNYKNLLKYIHLDKIGHYLAGGVNDKQIDLIMNGPIKKQLGIIPERVIWGGQSNEVFNAQEGDFMKPVVSSVLELLNNEIIVNVWNGQLDLICDTLGTLQWIRTLNWKYLSQWQLSEKQAVLNIWSNNTDVAYFKKSYRNLNMYFMMKAGHMVPADNGIAALQAMLDMVFETS